MELENKNVKVRRKLEVKKGDRKRYEIKWVNFQLINSEKWM